MPQTAVPVPTFSQLDQFALAQANIGNISNAIQLLAVEVFWLFLYVESDRQLGFLVPTLRIDSGLTDEILVCLCILGQQKL